MRPLDTPMKVKMLTSMAGLNFSRAAGEIHEIEDEEAAKLCARGAAEPVDKAGEKLAAAARKQIEEEDAAAEKAKEVVAPEGSKTSENGEGSPKETADVKTPETATD